MMNMSLGKNVQLHKAILHELGFELNCDFSILDFGCGEGKTVNEYRAAGFNAFGVDVKLDNQCEFLRLIQSDDSYQIPFDTETFDFVFSEQVLEHVQDHSSALSEIHRVLKPGGLSLHIFPSKFNPIEPHVFVPFAGVFQGYRWLLFWASLGIRNSYQKGVNPRETARKNHDYLKHNTGYLSKKLIRRHALGFFNEIVFAEKHLIKHSYGYARHLYPVLRVFPFIKDLYSSLWYRVIFVRKETDRNNYDLKALDSPSPSDLSSRLR